MFNKVYCRLTDVDEWTEFHVSREVQEVADLKALCGKIPIDSEGRDDFIEGVKHEVKNLGLIPIGVDHFGWFREQEVA